MDKQALRQQLRQLSRTELTDALRQQGSASVRAQLQEHPLWQAARHIGLYMALPDEPDLSPLLEQASGKNFYLPRVLDGERMAFYPYLPGQVLERSASFGLLEPALGAEAVAPEELDLLVIPALGYDTRGYRLGRGKGYYDRYLAQTSAHRLGVTFALLPLQALPADPWDLPVEAVLAPQPALLPDPATR